MRTLPCGPKHSNCLFWAVSQWATKGGYLIVRRSKHSRWKCHFAWSRTGRFAWGYIPLHPRVGISALCHGLRFPGRIEREKSP